MRGIKSKQQQRVRKRDLALLERAVNENYAQAATFHMLWRCAEWQLFWQHIALAALCQYVQETCPLLRAAEVERATLFWPAEVLIGMEERTDG